MNEDSSFCDDEFDDQVKQKLLTTSFGDLVKLKEKIGTKVFNDTVFTGKKIPTNFKNRSSKRRNNDDDDPPLEISAKKKPPRLMHFIPTKKKQSRDPRFDSLCGEFDDRLFKKNYGFVNKLKQNDLKALKNELKNTTDPEEIKKIKYLIQRLENQLREEARKEEKKQLKAKENEEMMEAVKRGEKPVFKNKSERKILDLLSQYEKLKTNGKLKKHIERLRKKRNAKERKKSNTESHQLLDD